ncbi:2-hydroxyacylsphingosine 1-beta-galactosyltransferase-like [Lytechinus pictus]|uniref:2-hydroxyacylsphingosine 1-beta-galactosyltransferase-like n=1 Tax=Lytechinus pictus TaxID=7653 RepID=UPI0030B9C4F6
MRSRLVITMIFQWTFLVLCALKLFINFPTCGAHDLVLPSNLENDEGGRILLMFQGCGVKTSLFNLGLRLGEILRSEGYNVTFMTVTLPGDQNEVDDDSDLGGFSRVDIHSEGVINECHSLKDKILSMSGNRIVGMQQLLGLLKPQRILCEALLANQTTMAHLRSLELDMIISESFGPCHVILSHLLGGIPIANFLVVSPTILPHALFSQTIMDQTSILGRLQSTAEMMSIHLFYHRLWSFYSEIANKHGISELGNIFEFSSSYANASLWFLNADLVLDYPLTLPPNFVFLGDLTSHPPHQIVDQSLRLAIAGARSKGNIVVVSINTLARQLKETTEEAMVEGLSRVPFQILWRKGRPEVQTSPTDNIHYTGWIKNNDMNDLLGLNETVALVTTGGRCGIMEAIYHGVPVLCIPLMSSEHHENCAKIKNIGMGIILDIDSLTENDVYNAVAKLTLDKSFQTNAQRASRTFKSKQQSAGKRVEFWVKHVLQNGDGHLRNVGSGSFFSLIQYACLDLIIQLFILTFIAILIYRKMKQ